MNKNTNKNTDDIFKDRFEGFQVPPPSQNWENIEDSINSDVDQDFREKLQSFQVTPEAKIWKNIEEELPLHPKAKRYISWMTKIAAILVIGMLLSILSDQKKQEVALNNSEPSKPVSELDVPNQSTNILLEQDEKPAFVYEVEKSSTLKKRSGKYSTEEDENMKTLLQFILEDDEDLADLIDPKVIQESLESAEALEDEMALAQNNVETSEDIKFEIRIPLIVVETEQEAASLIQLYESSHAPVSRLD